MAKITYNDKDNIVNNVIQLKKEFRRTSGTSTFIHKQVYHKDNWYIYKAGPNNYEVFKEKISNTVQYIDGKISVTKQQKVKYPSDEDFGNWAWSCSSYYQALNIIEHRK